MYRFHDVHLHVTSQDGEARSSYMIDTYEGWKNEKKKTEGCSYLSFFSTYFYSGSVVLQVIFCHHSIETQEINIYVCLRMHSFKQDTGLASHAHTCTNVIKHIQVTK